MNERILVVDDEEPVREVLTRALFQDGFAVQAGASAGSAMELLAGNEFGLVLSDIKMPGHDGIWLLHEVLEKFPDTALIMVTSLSDVETAIHCLTEGADNYLVKPVNFAELGHACRRALERRRLLLENREYQQELERKVEEQTAQLKAALRDLEHAHKMVKEAQHETIHRLAAAAEFRDDDTAAHLRRMSSYSAVLARQLGMPKEEIALLEEASPMHDIGKIGVPDSILLKPGKLTGEEFELIKQHSEMGAKILSNPSSLLLQLAETVARSHHERWDGSGYPYGLADADIPLVGRIVALADVLDALTSKRCYKGAIPLEEAFSIIHSESGKHFDPRAVEGLLAATEEIRAIYEGTRSPTAMRKR